MNEFPLNDQCSKWIDQSVYTLPFENFSLERDITKHLNKTEKTNKQTDTRTVNDLYTYM